MCISLRPWTGELSATDFPPSLTSTLLDSICSAHLQWLSGTEWLGEVTERKGTETSHGADCRISYAGCLIWLLPWLEAELMLLANRVQRTTEQAFQTFPLGCCRCEYWFRKEAVESKEVAWRRNLLQVEPGGTGSTVPSLSTILPIQFPSWRIRLLRAATANHLSLILRNIFIFKM